MSWKRSDLHTQVGVTWHLGELTGAAPKAAKTTPARFKTKH